VFQSNHSETFNLRARGRDTFSIRAASGCDLSPIGERSVRAPDCIVANFAAIIAVVFHLNACGED
jgi:hypothetical protein